MTTQENPHTAQILPFEKPKAQKTQPSAPKGLGEFARERGTPDDYRHRQKVNAIAVLLLMGLIGGGIWLANMLADLRRDQDCAMAGRRNCAKTVVSPRLNQGVDAPAANDRTINRY